MIVENYISYIMDILGSESRISGTDEETSGVEYATENFKRICCTLVASVCSDIDGIRLRELIKLWSKELYSRMNRCNAILWIYEIEEKGPIVTHDDMRGMSFDEQIAWVNNQLRANAINGREIAGIIDSMLLHEVECFKSKCLKLSQEYADQADMIPVEYECLEERCVDSIVLSGHFSAMKYVLDRMCEKLERVCRCGDGLQPPDLSKVMEIVDEFKEKLEKSLDYFRWQVMEIWSYIDHWNFNEEAKIVRDMSEKAELSLQRAYFNDNIIYYMKSVYNQYPLN